MNKIKKGMVLEQFPKSVLIEFLRNSGVCFRYDSTNRLEAELLYIQYQQEVNASLKECDEAAAERAKHDWRSPEHKAARKRYERADARYKRAEKMYERVKQLRGY